MDFFECRGILTDDFTSIDILNKEYTKRMFRDLNGVELTIKVKPYKKRRSNNQNKWLWGVCYEYIKQWTLDNFGEVLSSEDIHLFVTTTVLGGKIETKKIMGEEVFTINRVETSKLNTEQFNNVKLKIQQFYAEKGLNIPDPE